MLNKNNAKRKIKVFFNGLPKNDFDLKNYFPFAVLFKNFNVEIVKSYLEAEVIFEATALGGKDYLDDKNKTIIVFSGENLFMKRNFFNWLERGVRLIVGNEKKYKVMDRLDKIIPSWIQKIPISSFFPEYIRFVKKINQRKNCYAILCNKDLKSKKILTYPLFLADFHHRMSELIKKKNKINIKDKKFCAFAVSSNSARERILFFKKLSKYKKIDSFGKAMNNMGPEFIGHWKKNDELFSQYKFIICFENCFVDDFITEKITNAMLSGGIPIYHGPLNTKEYFDTTSFINYDDFGSYEKMIKKIIELDQDDKKYINFLKRPWFYNNKIPKEFKEKERELVKFYKKIFEKLPAS